jgi:hypothetical protein
MLLDHVRHGEGLARPRHAQQRLREQAGLDTIDQFVDRLGLVSRRLERGVNRESLHGISVSSGAFGQVASSLRWHKAPILPAERNPRWPAPDRRRSNDPRRHARQRERDRDAT